MRTNKDTRGRCWYNLIDELEGQIDFAYNYPGTVRAFHYHDHKVEYMISLDGDFKFVLAWDDGRKEIHYLTKGEKIKIEPKCWHGYQVIGNKPGILLEWADKKHDLKNPDDKRKEWDFFDKWEIERK